MGEYSFHLPSSTGAIKKLGNVFQNCVASYAQKALKKKCTIVYALHKDEFEICIEVIGSKINQALGKFNNKPGGKNKEALNEWAVKNNLDL